VLQYSCRWICNVCGTKSLIVQWIECTLSIWAEQTRQQYWKIKQLRIKTTNNTMSHYENKITIYMYILATNTFLFGLKTQFLFFLNIKTQGYNCNSHLIFNVFFLIFFSCVSLLSLRSSLFHFPMFHSIFFSLQKWLFTVHIWSYYRCFLGFWTRNIEGTKIWFLGQMLLWFLAISGFERNSLWWIQIQQIPSPVVVRFFLLEFCIRTHCFFISILSCWLKINCYGSSLVN